MFRLRAPALLRRTQIDFDEAVLEAGTCGLFRAPLHLASQLMPSMAELIASVPVDDPSEWELDIKVHMLMPGQYPCIPNWHTDNVPRDEAGLRFDRLCGYSSPMLLWVSNGPETEFLKGEAAMPHAPGSHRELARFIEENMLEREAIKPQAWYSMDQRTPHRGTCAAAHGWRVFARVTHKSIAPARPVTSVIRRHAQVYLDASEFTW